VSLETLEKAADEVIQGFTAAQAKPSDLARAKTGLVASVIYRQDSQFSMASAYGQALMIGLTVDDVNEWPTRIRAVNAAEVQKAAQGLIRRNAVTAYLVPGMPK
jgi:zinc protease